MTELALPKHLAVQKAEERFAQRMAQHAAQEAALEQAKIDARIADAITDGRSAEHVWGVETPIPEGVPDPGLWRVALMPVGQVQKTRGSIILPDETLDTQNWTHPLWKVLKVGPLACRGPAYAGFTEEELAETRANLVPGALYLVDAKAPRRYDLRVQVWDADKNAMVDKKMVIIVVNDDQLWSRVDPAHLDKLSFRGLDL